MAITQACKNQEEKNVQQVIINQFDKAYLSDSQTERLSPNKIYLKAGKNKV
jgi:hypothetical protein